MITYLYVKRHVKTGLKYFGKTTKKDPYSYRGSGKYWLRHIKLHGVEDVETLEVWEFDIIEECSQFALKFSSDHQIVTSETWANLKPENGLDGGSPKTGKPLSAEHKRKLSEALKGKTSNPEQRARLSKALTGRKRSEEHCRNISEAAKGRKLPPKSKETRDKISERRRGTTHSPETIAKLKEAKQGERNPFHGRKYSEETRRRMSDAAKAARASRANK